MVHLNLPQYPLKRRKSEEGREDIFDPFRKKWIKLTPEEWVRQNFLTWLVMEKKFPLALIAVERSLKVNKMSRRFDAVLFRSDGSTGILMEFKAPHIKLSYHVVDQIAAYNTTVKADYLILSNGLIHFCVKMDYKNNRTTFLTEIPEYIKL